MHAEQDRPGIPAARPVEAVAYREDASDDGRDAPWYRDVDAWVRGVMAGATVLAWVLTDLGPAALTATVVVAGTSDLRERTRRGGVGWWAVLELGVYALILVVTLAVTRDVRPLPGAQLVLQLVAGALVGAVVAAACVVLSRRAAPEAPPTAA